MKRGKRHLTGGMQQPNQDKIRTLFEKETYKYLAILEADTIKLVEIKTNFLKNISVELENYLRRNSLAKTLSKE